MNETEAPQLPRQEVQVTISDEVLADRVRALKLKQKKWLIFVSICIGFLIIGQSSAKLLQNFYYVHNRREDYDEKKQYSGTWMQALLQNVAFPLLLLPLLFFSSKQTTPNATTITTNTLLTNINTKSSIPTLLLVYLSLGVLQATQTKLYSLGKLYANIGIFTLISSTQLIFTSTFAFLINRNKFDVWIILSIILVTLAGAGTITSKFGGAPDENEENDKIASWLTFCGTVAFSLYISLTHLSFDKGLIPKKNKKCSTISIVLETQFSVSLVASIICIVGLLASQEYKDIQRETETFTKGKTLYVLTFVGLALAWQFCYVGLVGLVFLVSCLFSSLIFMFTWPIISILVVIVFNFQDDQIDRVKQGAMALALLGFASYLYSLHKLQKKELKQLTNNQLGLD